MTGNQNDKEKSFIIPFQGKSYKISPYNDDKTLQGRNGYVRFFANGAYAIKVLFQAHENKKYNRFKEEIDVLTKLAKQPAAQANNIVKLLDSHLPTHSSIKNGKDRAWYIMPKLNRYNQLENYSLEYILKLLKDILRAICFIHKHNYSHRDIKLDNILCDSKGTWFLCDFGLVIDSEAEQRLSSGNETIGPSGRPPELEPISKGADSAIYMRSDIYLFGKLCWQLLTKSGSFFTGPFLFHTFALTKIEEAANRISYPIFPLIQLMFEAIQDDMGSRCSEERIEQLLDEEENIIKSGDPNKTMFHKQQYFFYKNRSHNQQEIYTKKEEMRNFFSSIESITANITQNHQTQSFYTRVIEDISGNDVKISLLYQNQKIIGGIESITVIEEPDTNYKVKVNFTIVNNCPIDKQFSLDKPITDSPLYISNDTVLDFEI
jgi:serine/threonine protein kinase